MLGFSPIAALPLASGGAAVSGVAVYAPAAAVSIAVAAPGVSSGASVACPSIDLEISAFIPSVLTGASVAAPAADLAISSFSPVIFLAITTRVPAADIAVAALAPSVATGASSSVPAAGATVLAHVPGVATSALVSVPSVSFTIGRQAPIIITVGLTYPLSLPDGIRVAQISFNGESAVTRSESPFTFKQQVVRFPGQRWSVDINIPPFRRETMEPLVAFLLALNGPEKTFLLGDTKNRLPRGSGRGIVLVNGSGQTGNSLTVDDATPNTVGWLKAGDWIQLGTGASSQLYKVLQDVTTDGDGNARIFIWPDLRVSPADNAVVRLENTSGVFRLANNNTAWSINEVCTYGISFSAVEAV
jgi:hypothetical protein